MPATYHELYYPKRDLSSAQWDYYVGLMGLHRNAYQLLRKKHNKAETGFLLPDRLRNAEQDKSDWHSCFKKYSSEFNSMTKHHLCREPELTKQLSFFDE